MQGLLLINKSEGITSFKAVADIRKKSGEKRVGHTGTLDPMATGVLPLLVGRATVLSSYLLDADKRYTAKIKLGIETDSLDITGNIVSQSAVNVTNDELKSVLNRFVGNIEQTPPMYSAIKKNGVRMYALARKGIDVELPKRSVKIYSINQISALDENNEFSIDVKVSKGTYIRSLCRDIGVSLGCGATLTALERTETGGFSIEQCTPLSDITADNIGEHLLAADKAVEYMPSVNITENQAFRFSNGGSLDLSRIKIKESVDGTIFRVYCNGVFLGLGIVDKQSNSLKFKCLVEFYER